MWRTKALLVSSGLLLGSGLGCKSTDFECEVDSGCDDGDPCTRNICTGDGQCEYNIDDKLIPDDHIHCTIDVCTAGVATHEPDDGKCDPCQGQTCDGELGCLDGIPLPLKDDKNPCTIEDCMEGLTIHIVRQAESACEVCITDPDNPDNYTWGPIEAQFDNDPCTQDLCVEDEKNPGVPIITHPDVVIDDGVSCTFDACNEDTGEITHLPNHEMCQDTLFCNGEEFCDLALGCSDGADPDDELFCTDCVETETGPIFVTNDLLCGAGGTCDETIDCILPAGSVIVSEFVALASDTQPQMIELQNLTDSDVNLARYSLQFVVGGAQPIFAASAPGTASAPAWLPAGGAAYGVANPSDSAEIPLDATFVWGTAGSADSLDASGDVIQVIDNNDVTQDTLDFTAFVTDVGAALGVSDFPGAAGISTQLQPASDADDNDDGSSWCLTFRAATTAGQANFDCGAQVINEVCYDADSPGGAGTDDGRVFVEIAGAGGSVLDGIRLIGVQGEGEFAGDDNTEPSVTIAPAVRMPLDGLFVIADGLGGGSTLVPNSDLVVDGAGDPENGGDALQLVAADGSLLDAVGYGVVDAAIDTTRGLATFEGDPAPDADPESVGYSLARDALSTDTDDNAIDFRLDPSPSPGEHNEPVVPTIVELTPNDALGATGGTVRFTVVDFADTSDTPVRATFGFTLEVDCTFPVDDDPSIVECDAPAYLFGAEAVDVILANPPEAGSSVTLVDGFTYTDVSTDIDDCALGGPTDLTVGVGETSSEVTGTIFEAGLTDESSSAAAGILGEIGYGPVDSDPRTDEGWTFYTADPDITWDFSGDDDGYVGTLTVDIGGDYAYTYRFSLDDGLTFSYCDSTGGGFDPSLLGALTVQE